MGNGIYTFVDEKTKFNDFFDENEVGSYKSVDDLGNKIENLLSSEKKIDTYARNGKKKYFKLFNNVKISKEIIEKVF